MNQHFVKRFSSSRWKSMLEEMNPTHFNFHIFRDTSHSVKVLSVSLSQSSVLWKHSTVFKPQRVEESIDTFSLSSSHIRTSELRPGSNVQSLETHNPFPWNYNNYVPCFINLSFYLFSGNLSTNWSLFLLIQMSTCNSSCN